MAWFVIILLVAGVIILALYYLQARYEVQLSNWINQHVPIWEPEDDYDVWLCCNHCFTEQGELIHPLNFMDKHTVPCNEPGCSQNAESF